nr:MAG TPA: hypothetical protein [Caudoviricetes sp.]
MHYKLLLIIGIIHFRDIRMLINLDILPYLQMQHKH